MTGFSVSLRLAQALSFAHANAVHHSRFPYSIWIQKEVGAELLLIGNTQFILDFESGFSQIGIRKTNSLHYQGNARVVDILRFNLYLLVI
jgi:hypothetical protein